MLEGLSFVVGMFTVSRYSSRRFLRRAYLAVRSHLRSVYLGRQIWHLQIDVPEQCRLRYLG
jgi:hypothetical protein